MPPGELPTISEVLDQYHQATLRDAEQLAKRTGLPLDECVSYSLPFQAHIAAATLDILSFARSDSSTKGKGEAILPPTTE